MRGPATAIGCCYITYLDSNSYGHAWPWPAGSRCASKKRPRHRQGQPSSGRLQGGIAAHLDTQNPSSDVPELLGTPRRLRARVREFCSAPSRPRLAAAVRTIAVRRSRRMPGGKGDVPAVAATPLPDHEADELQAFERAFGEVQLGSASLPEGVPLSFGVILTVTCLLLFAVVDREFLPSR